MAFNSLIQGYQSFITLGADSSTSKKELKKIKLFNIFTLVWYLIAIPLIARRFFTPNKEYSTIVVHLIICSLLFLGQMLHKNKKYTLGRVIYILCLLSISFYFSNIVYFGNFSELYYYIVPPISLIFIDNKYINYLVLTVSILLFAIPNLYLGFYPKDAYNDFTNYSLFVIIYIIVNYFKEINIKNEKALESKKNELERINKYQSQFFINVSHEIRTPLTLIKGQIDELKELPNQVPALISAQKELNTQTNKIADMVNDVLDIAKMESGLFKLNYSNVNLSELTSKIFHSFESAFKQKNITYSFKRNNRVFLVNADQSKLEKALNNIITNALKFTERNGEVSVNIKKKKDQVIISVSDTGLGIPDSDIFKIFNKFYQVDNDVNQTGGTGIGLSFSKEIIELHNGKIIVKNNEKQGATFEIHLPLIEMQKQEKLQLLHHTEKEFNETLGVDISIFKETIFLIIDDNIEMRKHIKKCLKGGTHLEAENGKEAIKIIKTQNVDFIIVDYMMPKMNGKEFVESARALNYMIPIIMLTARADQESKLEVLRLGIDDYLTKPFDKTELALRIHNALGNYYHRTHYIDTKNINKQELTQSERWIRKIELFIEKECATRKLNQDQIAEYFNVSLSTLSRRIQSVSGQKPKEFIKEIKLQKARKLIESDPDISLKELSLSVGYLHNYNFSELYFKRFGNRPWKEVK